MSNYVLRYTKRIEQVHKRERTLLGALKRGEELDRLKERAEALRAAKVGALKSAKANPRRGVAVSCAAEEEWLAMSVDDIIDLYRKEVAES